MLVAVKEAGNVDQGGEGREEEAEHDSLQQELPPGEGRGEEPRQLPPPLLPSLLCPHRHPVSRGVRLPGQPSNIGYYTPFQIKYGCGNVEFCGRIHSDVIY